MQQLNDGVSSVESRQFEELHAWLDLTSHGASPISSPSILSNPVCNITYTLYFISHNMSMTSTSFTLRFRILFSICCIPLVNNPHTHTCSNSVFIFFPTLDNEFHELIYTERIWIILLLVVIGIASVPV